MKPIEAVAKALALADWCGPDDEEPNWKPYVDDARVAIAALADNISDEAVKAASREWFGFTELQNPDLRDKLQRTIAAAILALGKD